MKKTIKIVKNFPNVNMSTECIEIEKKKRAANPLSGLAAKN
jgi:hypothetical protein